MILRDLDPARDRAAVQDLYHRAADYVRLETGADPAPDAAARFFADTAPGIDVRTGLKLGAVQGERVLGVLDASFGYPDPQDAYIGLLMLDPATRGQGLGPRLLRLFETRARARGATRALVAVLQSNPAGLRFWTREGMTEERRFPPTDSVPHVRIRMTKTL